MPPGGWPVRRSLNTPPPRDGECSPNNIPSILSKTCIEMWPLLCRRMRKHESNDGSAPMALEAGACITESAEYPSHRRLPGFVVGKNNNNNGVGSGLRGLSALCGQSGRGVARVSGIFHATRIPDAIVRNPIIRMAKEISNASANAPASMAPTA